MKHITRLLIFLPVLLAACASTQPPAPGQPQEQAAASVQEEQAPGPATPEEVAPSTEEEPAALEEPQPQQETAGTYIIKRGDTLWDISNSLLKDPFLWPLLWKANPYINNPDLIYPGNKLAIPSLAPIERAMKAPPRKAPEKVTAPPPTAAKPVPKEAAAAKPRLILPEEAPVPIIDKYAMLSAGFVNMEDTGDMIVGAWEPKTIYSYDDIVYIHIASSQETKVGDKFIIYDPLGNVRHPVTGEIYGRLIKVLGVLQVTAKDSPDVLTARITLSFDACRKGSRLTPYQEPTLIYKRTQKREKDISGYILEVVDGRTINAQGDIVYLDKGSADGVEPGDRFTVYIEPDNGGSYGAPGTQYHEQYRFPRKAVGEVQVFTVKERTSTAVVRKSIDVLAIGDMVEYKK